MNKSTISRFIGIAALVLSAYNARAQDSLLGVTFFGNELISIDPTTGNGTLIGSLGANVSPYGIADRFGSLYTFNPNISRIQQIDPSTAQIIGSVDIGVGAIQGEGDLAFRSDGTGFLATSLDAGFNPINALYSFDITTGSSALIGHSSVALDGLAFDGNTLYAVGQGAGQLFRVDPATAALTAIGDLGISQDSPIAGLSFGSNGQLYGAIDDRLYTIDKLTGAATPISQTVLDFGFSSVSGLTFQATGPVPDQGSSLSLLAWSIVGLFGYQRKTKIS